MVNKRMNYNTSDCVEEYLETLERIRSGWNPIFKTGYEGLNLILGGGLPKNTVTMLGGFSGTGKTTYALNVLNSIDFSKEHVEILFYNFETSKMKLYQLFLAESLGVTTKQLLIPEFMDANKEKVDKATKKWISLNMSVYDDNYSPEQISRYLMDKMDKEREDPKNKNKEYLMFLDHSLLLDGDDSRVDRLGKELLHLKMKYKCFNALILSQMNDGMIVYDTKNQGFKVNHPTFKDFYRGRQLYNACDAVLCLISPRLFSKHIPDYEKKYEVVVDYYSFISDKPIAEINFKDRSQYKILDKYEKNILFLAPVKTRDEGTSGQHAVAVYVDQLKFRRFLEVKDLRHVQLGSKYVLFYNEETHDYKWVTLL